MLPLIGLMVGIIGCTVSMYIITRCSHLMGEDVGIGIKILATATAAAAVLAIVALLFLSFSLISSGMDG